MATRDQLIEQLRDDNRGGVQVYHPNARALIWGAVTWVIVLAPMLWVHALRPGWMQQLTSYPRFAVETASGLLAVGLLGVLLFQLGIPGSKRRGLTIGIIISASVWLISLLIGLYYPTLEPSMAGKREFCRYEVLVYAIGPFLLGLYFLQRAYVLNWTFSAMVVGIASALVPAWLMQLGCMYDPHHALVDHLGPVVAVAIFATLVGFLMQRKKS